MKTYIDMKRHDKINIFEHSKFGVHFTFNGDDCIFLQQICEGNKEDGSEALYELAVHRHIKFTDGTEKDFVSIMRVHPDGFAYAIDDENDEPIYLYVKPCDIDTKKGE